MKQAMINSMKSGIHDELYTPDYAVYPLLPYLDKSKIYWECTDYGSSNITKVLKNNGFKVVSTHIKGGLDFLKDEPDFYFDAIITNPPYSLKTQFLKRAYKIGKPFAFLLPITALEGIERGKLYREYGIQVLVLDRRVNFIENKSVWFNTSWFCYKILPNDLMFAHLDI